ncbi:MAG: 6-phosphogluconolactonase [Myxococcota bacterium]
MAKYTLIEFPSEQEFIDHAVADFMRLATDAIAARGKFSVALSGGGTPKAIYEALVKLDIDWTKVHFYFGDERYVSHVDPMSNFAMVQKSLFCHINLPNPNIHSINTDQPDPHEAAKAYENHIGDMRFDLVYLGIGADGHTASIFPGILVPENQKVSAFYVHKLGGYRISLLPNFINTAHQIRFLVSGASKKPVLEYIMQEPELPLKYPCQLIRACEILAHAI